MMELWYNVCGCGWERREEETARRGGAVGGSTCCAYEDLVHTWVEIRAGGIGGKVVAAGVSVGYCGILWGKEGVWGGASSRGRRTIFSIECKI